MDVQTIDQTYAQLQTQSNQTVQCLKAFNDKLQAAAATGDANAREYSLDLRELALAIREEQQQVGALLQSLHDFVVNNAHQPVASAPPVYTAPPAPVQMAAPGGGGLLSRFLGGGFGQAMGMGAGMGVGVGVGETLINDLFN